MNAETKNLKKTVKSWLMSIFNKKQETKDVQEAKDVKEIIKRWIINIDQTDKLPSDIVALNFNLYEGPYAIDMIGSASFDEEDDDWACDKDFEPTQRLCPCLGLSDDLKWEEVLEMIVSILKDLVDELSDLKIFQVEHIAVGFDDGDLTIIK